MSSERAHENVTPSADPNFDTLPEAVDDDEDWNLNGTIGGLFVQCVGVECLLQYQRDECRYKRWRVPTIVAEAVEIFKS